MQVNFQQIVARIWQNVRPLAERLGCFIKAKIRKHPGGAASLGLHIVLLLLIVGALPSWFADEPEPVKKIIRVDMAPVKEETNVKPEPPKPKVRHSPVKKVHSKPKPPPPPKKQKPPPPKKVAKSKPEKPKPQKQAEQQPDFASVLKSVESLKDQSKPVQQAPSDIMKPLSISERDRIADSVRRQIEKHWNIPAGAQGAEDMVIKLQFNLGRDGIISNVAIVDMARYRSDAVFKASADSAMRAAYRASPIKDLPLQYFAEWRSIELNFDPRDVF